MNIVDAFVRKRVNNYEPRWSQTRLYSYICPLLLNY